MTDTDLAVSATALLLDVALPADGGPWRELSVTDGCDGHEAIGYGRYVAGVYRVVVQVLDTAGMDLAAAEFAELDERLP